MVIPICTLPFHYVQTSIPPTSLMVTWLSMRICASFRSSCSWAAGQIQSVELRFLVVRGVYAGWTCLRTGFAGGFYKHVGVCKLCVPSTFLLSAGSRKIFLSCPNMCLFQKVFGILSMLILCCALAPCHPFLKHDCIVCRRFFEYNMRHARSAKN